MILSMLENGKVVKAACGEPKFDYFCNVLCVGAGSAGVYAADSAAREGADVILCEIGENIGGMHVCGNVNGYYYGARGGSYEQDDIKSSQ
ncbi:MAG: FAD-dependent oxidoreductase, partial [Ruminococcaceae bacterium]|nr:FAD-dependent oxidoreductase [Oscillospiraceae bacterium]